MPDPVYSLGIDLGTSNCALAATDLRTDRPTSEGVLLSQAVGPDTRSEHRTLPSFLFRPSEEGADWIPGLHARDMSFVQPGRVVHSAKSWLCHPAVDRQANLLPWHSPDLPAAERLSPVDASARLLRHIRADWESRSGLRLPEQRVSLTVPASFDAAAQQLTLEAALEAGFPKNTLLMEEPQAAFYRWLENHENADGVFPQDAPAVILILDIGGGTSDFSLFEVRPGDPPDIRRTAVGEHLLLGGDNLDRFLATRFRAELEQDGPELTAGQWSALLAESRRVKEALFSDDIPVPERVTLAGAGSGLFADTRILPLDPDRLRADLLDAFFPACPPDAQPETTRSGLRELGLPYAKDPAVTRHLAAFLRDRPAVDFVLCNGGTLAAPVLQERLRERIGVWQNGRLPQLLVNPEPDLAVARGASVYGARLHRKHGVIEAGAARSVYLETVDRKTREARRMCILPQGSPPDAVHRVDDHPLRVTVDTPVRFQAYSSARRPEDQPGDFLRPEQADLHPLPSMQTQIEIPAKGPKPANNLVQVAVEAQCTAAGLLKVFLVSRDRSWRGKGSWELVFNLRATDSGDDTETASASPSPREKEADHAIRGVLGKKAGDDPRPARRLFGEVESILQAKRKDWSLLTCRRLWPAVGEGLTRRNRSKDHEAAWLNLAGFVLRPGFGVELDSVRVNELWRLHELGLNFPKEARSRTQLWILWRRVAGGLDSEQQTLIARKWLGPLTSGGAAPLELIRLAGSLERVDADTKRTWIDHVLRRLPKASRSETSALAWTLGGLLGRIPFGGGPEDVLPPGDVVDAFQRLQNAPGVDWKSEELRRALLNAARITNEVHLDLPEENRNTIATFLEQQGVAPEALTPLREFVREQEEERALRFGESLPPGLTLGSP